MHLFFSLLTRTNKEKAEVRKQTVTPLQSRLLVAIAAVIVLGASNSVIAQNKAADKYPKPDFSAMEEYWEVVEYEYDFGTTSNVPNFIVIAKPKQKVVPTGWDITWVDSKGVKIAKYMIYFPHAQVMQSKVGDPIRGQSKAPFKREMAQVKSVTIIENPDSGDSKTTN
jgi:hypothetical protein